MNRSYILVLSALFFCLVASAQTDTLGTEPVDTFAVTEEDYLKLLESHRQQVDTVKKVVDRGRDVSRYVNVRRQRAADVSPFVSERFVDNMFLSLRGNMFKLAPEDYSFGIGGGLSFGKWLHQDHALRLDLDYSQWKDNLDGAPITDIEIGASYLFNLSSYVGGYRSNRLCEVSLVTGLGYSNSTRVRYPDGQSKDVATGHAFHANVGFNLNLRIFRDIDLFIEPVASLYTNGVALYYTGNWRRWMAAFKGSVGLTYNIRGTSPEPSHKQLPREKGWFIAVMGGPHLQNSDIVYSELGLGKALGVHVGLSIGKYYTDYFAIRYSAAYSRGSWMIYDEEEMPCNYFSVRAEGMLDAVSLIREASRKEGNDRRSMFALSLLLGPEIGYMYKVDKDLVVNTAYIGLTGGVQAKFNITDRFSLFMEPRFLVLPYDAPSHDATIVNDYRNYYDGLFNVNLGIEFML